MVLFFKVKKITFTVLLIQIQWSLYFSRNYTSSEANFWHNRNKLAFTFAVLKPIAYNFTRPIRINSLQFPIIFIKIAFIQCTSSFSLLKSTPCASNRYIMHCISDAFLRLCRIHRVYIIAIATILLRSTACAICCRSGRKGNF